MQEVVVNFVIRMAFLLGDAIKDPDFLVGIATKFGRIFSHMLPLWGHMHNGAFLYDTSHCLQCQAQIFQGCLLIHLTLRFMSPGTQIGRQRLLLRIVPKLQGLAPQKLRPDSSLCIAIF